MVHASLYGRDKCHEGSRARSCDKDILITPNGFAGFRQSIEPFKDFCGLPRVRMGLLCEISMVQPPYTDDAITGPEGQLPIS